MPPAAPPRAALVALVREYGDAVGARAAPLRDSGPWDNRSDGGRFNNAAARDPGIGGVGAERGSLVGRRRV